VCKSSTAPDSALCSLCLQLVASITSLKKTPPHFQMGVEVVDLILKSLKMLQYLKFAERGKIWYVHEVESMKIGNGTVLYDCYCCSTYCL
jgi:hypothetical protein